MRLTPSHTALCVIDVQEKLIPTIPTGQHLITECCRLIETANLFDTPVLFTEQYPKGLGPTVAPIVMKITHQNAIEKLSFSCCGTPTFLDQIPQDVENTHSVWHRDSYLCPHRLYSMCCSLAFVSALQSTQLAAVTNMTHTVALRRLEGSGAVLSTTEAILFELCATAENPAFKKNAAARCEISNTTESQFL